MTCHCNRYTHSNSWRSFCLTKFEVSNHLIADRYCKLLESEGGVELLTDLLAANTATQTMKRYAEMTLSKI